MKTAVDKNEFHFDRMKRQSFKWLEKHTTAPPFLHLALNQFKPSDCQRSKLIDEEIEKAAMEYENKRRYLSSPSTAYACFMDGAKWARDRKKEVKNK